MTRTRGPKPRRYARWRAVCLIAVHLSIGIHIAHWKIAGRTLAPLELNEVMHTLELGVVTAGFLLMVTAVLSVAVFGRFFCSWGCHLLALEDLAAWLLAKVRIRPVPVRSRLLRWIPIAAAFYMFFWPQVARGLVRLWPATGSAVGARPEFRWRVLGDGEGWASFLTTDFARNLPGPGMALVTFLVCGFVIVWLLGTRAFCRDVCPYGAVFSFADRFAPGRIVLAGDCTACARCTAVCDSGIRVHEEIARDGAVTSGECLKDLDCVGICPTGGLAFGFRKPPLLGRRGVAQRWDLAWPEEGVAAGVFLLVLLATRGLYRLIPFLLSLALAAMAAFAAVLALRFLRRPEVRLQRWALKSAGRITARGWTFAVAVPILALATTHAGLVRFHEWWGDRAWDEWRLRQQSGLPARGEALRALGHAEARERLGWIRPPDLLPRLATLRRTLGRFGEAEADLRRLAPEDLRARLDLAELLATTGRLAAAEVELRAAIADAPRSAPAHYGLGVVLGALGRTEEAVAALENARTLDPDDPQVLNNLGFLLGTLGRVSEAEPLLRRARNLAPGWPLPCYNLVALLDEMDRDAEAESLAATCPSASAGDRR